MFYCALGAFASMERLRVGVDTGAASRRVARPTAYA